MDDGSPSVRRALERGELLVAFDEARSAVLAGEASISTRWLGVLALARAGSTDRARRYFDGWDLLAGVDDDDRQLTEDLLGLDARIAKDGALSSAGAERSTRCRHAAAAYESIWDRLGRPYAGVNAATLWLLAGEVRRATDLARLVDQAAAASAASTPSERYWQSVTRAECELIQARIDAAAAHLTDAERSGYGDLSARASTRRQLTVLCDHIGASTTLLDALPVPGVIHYTGHMAGPSAGRYPADHDDDLRATIAAELERRSVGFGYGSLGAGADIAIAEQLLARGAELHVLLPSPEAAFVEQSVAPAGERWTARFGTCLSAATSVTHVTEEPDVTDPVLLAYNACVAMGSARLQARRLGSEPLQLAVWDGTAGQADAGTGHEVRTWNAAGLHTDVVAVSGPGSSDASPIADRPATRPVRSVLVADFKGFGRLGDEQIATFVEQVATRLAQVLDLHAGSVFDRNLWGDGLQVFFDEPTAAARFALGMQRAVSEIDLAAIGLPPDLGLRVSLHAGPMLELLDPVRGVPTCFGAQITKAARIDPATPEGDVYMTEAFAALLTLQGPDGLECQYVGREATAKDFGVMPLYLLR